MDFASSFDSLASRLSIPVSFSMKDYIDSTPVPRPASAARRQPRPAVARRGAVSVQVKRAHGSSKFVRQSFAPFFIPLDSRGWFLFVSVGEAYLITPDLKDCEFFGSANEASTLDNQLLIGDRRFAFNPDLAIERLDGTPGSIFALCSFFRCAVAAQAIPPFCSVTLPFYRSTIMNQNFLASFACLPFAFRTSVNWSIWMSVIEPFFEAVMRLLFRLEFQHAESVGQIFRPFALLSTIVPAVLSRDSSFIGFAKEYAAGNGPPLSDVRYCEFTPRTKVMLFCCYWEAQARERMNGIGVLRKFFQVFSGLLFEEPEFDAFLLQFAQFPQDYIEPKMVMRDLAGWTRLIALVAADIGNIAIGVNVYAAFATAATA
jgi:hypothetical protein